MTRFLSVLLVLACACRTQAQPAATYQGKTAREWVQTLDDPEADRRYQAVAALGQLGPDAREAVPALLQLLKDKPRGADAGRAPNTLSDLATLAAESLAHIGPAGVPALTRALESEHARVRAGAALALGLVRPKATPAATALQAALKDRDEQVRLLAALALWSIEEKSDAVVRTLAEALRGLNPSLRQRAAVELREFGPVAEPAVPALIEALRDEFLEVPSYIPTADPGHTFALPLSVAAQALAAVGEKAVPALVKAAGDREPQVRASALLALSSMPPGCKEVAPALRGAIQDRDATVRLVAAINFWRRERAWKPVVPVLLETLKGTDRDLAAAAALVLGQIHEAARDTVPVLLEQWQTPEGGALAATALRLLGREAVPALAKLLGDEKLSAQAVVQLQSMMPYSLPDALKGLDSGNARVRAAAAEVLAAAGFHAARVVPALREAARDIDSRVRFQALVGLSRLDLEGDADTVALRLADFVKQKNFPHRALAVQALGQLGRRATKATPALTAALRDTEVTHRKEITHALARIGLLEGDALEAVLEAVSGRDWPAALVPRLPSSALPNLVDLLREAEPSLRIRAIHLLAAMAVEVPRAIPVLALALEDRDGNVSVQAIHAVQQLGPRAKSVLPILEKRLKDPGAQAQELLRAAARLGPEGVAVVQRIAGEKSILRPLAFQVLGDLRQQARPALPVLTAALKNEDPAIQLAAARALARISARAADVLPALRPMLKSDDVEVRRQAVVLLGEWATSDPAVLPLLIEALQDRDSFAPLRQPYPPGAHRQFGAFVSESVRREAAVDLGRAGQAAKAATPVLVKMLASELTSDRSLAATLLGEIGPEAKEAIPALRKLLKDERSVRIAAAEALSRLDVKATEAIPILIDALRDEAPLLGQPGPARDGLRRFGTAALPALVAMLRECEVGPQVQDALGLSASLDAVHRATLAAEVLGQIGKDAGTAVPALLEVLRDPRIDQLEKGFVGQDLFAGSNLRLAVVTALGRIGMNTEEVRKELARVERSPSAAPALRLAALEAFVRVAQEGQKDLVPVRDFLHGALVNAALTPDAFTYLIEQKALAKEMAPLLIVLLKDRNPPLAPLWDRTVAARLLGKLGKEASAAVPALREALADASPALRSAVAVALWRIEGKDGAVAARVLVEELRESADFAPTSGAGRRLDIVKELAALGRDAAPALPLLKDLLDDPDRDVRAAAAEAVKKIE